MRNPFDRGLFGQAPDPAAYQIGQVQGGAGASLPDDRVRRALEAIDYPYEISPAQAFRVVVSWTDEDRTQLVLVSSHTATYRDREWRKVWSNAFDVTGRLSWEQALALLADSDTYVFGAWCAEERDGKTTVYFQVSLPADAPPEELHDAILLVAATADDWEKATVGTDAN